MSHPTAVAPILRVDGLHLTAGSTTLVEDVSLTLARGETLALVGASGCGKTLTCRAIAGVLPASVQQQSGAITWGTDRPPGFVLQGPRTAFNPLLTLGQHFAETFAAKALVSRGTVARARTRDLLTEVGLEGSDRMLARYPHQLSGGMLQRAMIALCLIGDPPLLIADEPTSDLDLIGQAEILALLDRLQASRHLAILLVTHDLSVVAWLAHHLAVMDAGRLMEVGPVEQLFDTPQSPITRALRDAHLALHGLEAPVSQLAAE